MGIVIITMPGKAKMAFANSLHQKTNGGVDLVIVQRWKPDHSGTDLRKLARKQPLRFLMELRGAVLLRFRSKFRKTLNYFHEYTPPSPAPKQYLPKFVFVDSINGEEAYALLKKTAPSLLVVWGSNILKPRIIATAKKAVNLHIGRCPYYRGTLANQLAVLERDREHIGATVHEVSPDVDAGKIFTVVKPDLLKGPRELFCDLNDRAQSAYIDIITKLSRGEDVQGVAQDNVKGKNLPLKSWTPALRYRVAKEMRRWEKAYEEETMQDRVSQEAF